MITLLPPPRGGGYDGGGWVLDGLFAAGGAPDWFWPALFAAIVVLAALAVWAVRRIVRDMGQAGAGMIRATGDAAVALADGLAAAVQRSFRLQPRVTIEGRTHLTGTAPLLELVTARHTITRSHAWSHTWLWSRKRIHMTATFTVKAGFDLRQPLEIDVRRDPVKAVVRLPTPAVLSVQIESLEPAQEEHGWWNRITADERAQVQAEMQRLVQQDAVESGLLGQAEDELRALLRQAAAERGAGVEFLSLGEAPRLTATAAAADR